MKRWAWLGWLLASCATVSVRPCPHGPDASVYLSVRTMDDSTAPPAQPSFSVPGGIPSQLFPTPYSAQVTVTVHNTDGWQEQVGLVCGTDGWKQHLVLLMQPHQEHDLYFSLPRRVGLHVHFYCEVEEAHAVSP